VWRLVISETYRGTSPDDIRSRWSYEDVVDAHMLLDMIEDMAAEELRKAKAQRA
jgi:hypothetical protein